MPTRCFAQWLTALFCMRHNHKIIIVLNLIQLLSPVLVYCLNQTQPAEPCTNMLNLHGQSLTNSMKSIKTEIEIVLDYV